MPTDWDVRSPRPCPACSAALGFARGAAPTLCGCLRQLVPMHLAFSAECNPLFDWHSVGLFYSFEYAGQKGNITRLLACSAEQLKTYSLRPSSATA